MTPKLLELRANHTLLNSNFQGYKLSLEKITVLSKTLQAKPARVSPSTEDFSFLHASLFSNHNNLTGETCGENGSVYFVDADFCIQKAYLDEYSNDLILINVWEIPSPKERKAGDYNFSLKFASKNLAVVCDGTGMLYLCDTGSRSDNVKWQCVFCDDVIEPGKRFVIQDALCQEDKLHCLLFSIEQDSFSNKHLAVLYWITLLQAEDESWGAVALRKIHCKGNVPYAYFEPDVKAIYCITGGGSKFVLDSENPIKNESQPDSFNKKYEWIQTYENITLKFELPENFTKDDLRVNVETSEISISDKDETLFKGKFTNRVNSDLTTWTTVNHTLEVLLTKEEVGLMWTTVVEGDETGERSLDPKLVEEVHGRLGHLCSNTEVTQRQCEEGPLFSRLEIEECDIERNEFAIFERLCCNSHEVTHCSSLGSRQILLISKLSDLPPAIAVRDDVDGCLWQPLENGENFTLKHEGTLLAFGYIQASKTRRQFSACAPDLSYSVIADVDHHVFIYRQHKSLENAELRNRTTGRRSATVAQQQVVTITNGFIQGLYAANNVIFLLTENSIMALLL